MKKIVFLTVACCIFAAFCTHAQQRGPREKQTPEQHANRIVERLNKELKLTEKQQSELKTRFSESFKQREKSFAQNRDNREAIREQMKKEREAMKTELKKVLTAEQYKIYQTNEEKREKERAQRGPGHPGIPPHGNYPRN